jgi:hypothetical protein
MYYSRNRVGRALAFLIAGALSLSGIVPPASGAGLGNPPSSALLAGQMIVYGNVTVNGRPVMTGTSIFSDSLIRVACDSASSTIVRLGQGGQVSMIELRPGAQFQLNFSRNFVGGQLHQGGLRVRTPAGVKVGITTNDGVVTTDGASPALTPVRHRSGNCAYDQADQVASIENNVAAPGQNVQPSSVTRPTRGRPSTTSTAATTSGGLNPAALAALIFGVGVAGAITIVALTQSGYQVSPITP